MRHRKMNDAFVDYHLSIDARNPLLVPAMPLEWSIESFSVGLHKESQRRIRGIRGGGRLFAWFDLCWSNTRFVSGFYRGLFVLEARSKIPYYPDRYNYLISKVG